MHSRMRVLKLWGDRRKARNEVNKCNSERLHRKRKWEVTLDTGQREHQVTQFCVISGRWEKTFWEWRHTCRREVNWQSNKLMIYIHYPFLKSLNLLTCPFMVLTTLPQPSQSKNAWFPKVCCKIYIPVLWMWLVSKFWKRQTVNQFSLTHNLKEPCKKIRMLVFSSILQFHTIDNRYSWSAKIIPIVVLYANPS